MNFRGCGLFHFFLGLIFGSLRIVKHFLIQLFLLLFMLLNLLANFGSPLILNLFRTPFLPHYTLALFNLLPLKQNIKLHIHQLSFISIHTACQINLLQTLIKSLLLIKSLCLSFVRFKLQLFSFSFFCLRLRNKVIKHE